MKKIILSNILVLLTICGLSFATPVDIESTYLFRTIRGPNSVNYGVGDRMSVGARVSPVVSADGQTVVNAQNGGFTLTVPLIGDPINPNEFGRTIVYNPSLTSSWLITASNGSDTAQASTHSIGDVAAMPFVRNVQLSTQSGILTPTLSWTLPDDAARGDHLQIGLFDDKLNQRIWWGERLSIDKTSYTMPAGVLAPGGSYVMRVIITDTADNSMTGAPISRAETYINFTPTEASKPVYLPTLTEDANPFDNFGGAFLFDCDVVQGESILIDPYVAIGYDYAVGQGNPLFASVSLPFLGDNLYELYLFDEAAQQYQLSTQLKAGETYFFNNGASMFRVLGIEEALGIDPSNVTAFVTSLSFLGSGKFTGSMTPILGMVSDQQPVPEPATILLVGSGLVGLASYSRRKFRGSSPGTPYLIGNSTAN